jgi:hypothetical protein
MLKDAEIESPVVIIHHNTKGGDSPRGSGNIQAEPDTMLTLARDEDNNNLILKVTLARSIESDHEYHFTTESVDLGVNTQGYPLAAPVIHPVEPPTEADMAAERMTEEANVNAIIGEVADLFGSGSHDAKKFAVQLVYAAQAIHPPKALHTYMEKSKHTSRDVTELLMALIPPTGRFVSAQKSGKPYAIVLRMLKSDGEQHVHTIGVRTVN